VSGTLTAASNGLAASLAISLSSVSFATGVTGSTLAGPMTVDINTTLGTSGSFAQLSVSNGIVRVLGLELNGTLTLKVSATGVTMTGAGTAILRAGTTGTSTPVLTVTGVSGTLTAASNGLTASLTVSLNKVDFSTGAAGSTLSGAITIDINTTLGASSSFARLNVTGGKLTMLGLDLKGGFTLTVGASAVSMSLTGASVSLNVGTTSVLNFSVGSGAFEARSGGIVARFTLTHGTDVIGSALSGTATLEINTTTSLINLFNGAIVNLPANTARVHLAGSLGITGASAGGTFDFSVGAGVISVVTTNVTISLFGQTLSAGGSFTMGASGDFSATLSSNSFDVGVFVISGTLAFERVGGVFQIAVRGTPGRFSTTPPQIEIPGTGFTLTLDAFAVRSNGTFDVVAHINGTIGSSSLGLSATSVSLHKTGASLDTFSMTFAGGNLLILGTTISLGSFSLNNGGSLAGSVDPPDFDIGAFHFKTGKINFGPGDGHALQFWLIDSAGVAAFGSNLTLNTFYADSDGGFDMQVNGKLNVRGHSLDTVTFNVSAHANVLKFALPNATTLHLGFINVSVNGAASSDGTFRFAGSTSMSSSFNHASVSGTGTVTLDQNGFYGSFSGSGDIGGYSFASVSGTFNESGCLMVSASKLHVTAWAHFPLSSAADCVFDFGVSFDGYIEGAIVFLDANRNGVLDFLDLNGNGIQDENEPLEPSTTTTADGVFGFFVPAEFDTNGDGVIDGNEGRLVVIGGIDSTTLLPLDIPLMAPSGSEIVSPLTTLATVMSDQEGLSFDEASAQIIEALALPAVDIATFNPIAETLNGNSLGPAVFAALAQIQDTVVAVGQLIQGASGVSAQTAAFAAFSSLAHLTASSTTPLQFNNTNLVTSLIDAAMTIAGVTLTPQIIDAAAGVIAAGNAQIGNLTSVADENFLRAVARIQTVTQGTGASDLAAAAAGTLTIEALLQQNSGAGLTARIAAANIGNVASPELTISDVTIIEGNTGVSTATFTVTLSDAAALPVTVNLQTADGTATAADGDYTPAAILLTFAPGETVKTASVQISGDLAFESNETFFLQFLSAMGAHIGEFEGTATIVNDDTGAPVAHDDSANTNEDTPIAIDVLGNDFDPGGSMQPGSITITQTANHGTTAVNGSTGLVIYTPASDFSGIDSFRYTVTNALGLTSNIATVSIVIAPVNDAPVARNDSATTSELLPVTIAALANDTDVDGSLVAASLEIAAGPSHGTVQVNALTGVVTYTPDVEFAGIDSFRYSVRDDSGAVSNMATVTITVIALPEKSARLQADPVQTGLTALIVKGTSYDDDIRVASEGHSQVKVTIGNKSLGVFAPTGRIVILGGNGNDEIDADGNFAVPVEIHGGAGNDDLRGPSSPAILVGGSGNDVLIGGSGRDLLIGGTGTDKLSGKSGDDLLIGGWTRFDDNAIALASIFSTWTRKDLTFSERVSRIHYGVPGGVQLNSTTVFDDGRNDWLSGGSGVDWTIESGEHCWYRRSLEWVD
jgi:hypothetical protein